MKPKQASQGGYSIVELMIAMLIMGAMASAVMMARSYVAKQTVITTDKAFATQKAIQMFEELRADAGNQQTGLQLIDNYSDGSNYNAVLTTDKAVTSPADPLSANKKPNGYWKFWRQVEVLHLPQDPFARIITVKVYGGNNNNTANPGNALAEAGGLLRTITNVYSPSQVYDVYELAISNELGWFTVVPNMDAAFSQAVSAVQILNPGLVIRDHHVTQTAFGRDFFYNPYINQAQDTTHAVIPLIYFYPGNTPQDSVAPDTGSDAMFFSPAQLEAVGGINVDGNILNDNGYSMCDMFNTAMRYPDELAAYQAVSQANATASASALPYEMTLRMLLEKMNSQPASIMNPMIISMHGEVLPLVNMSNYSFAAKDPTNASGAGGANIRVVTHPTLIHYPHNSAVTLRVYAYYDGLLNPSLLDTTYPKTASNVASTITLYFPSVKLTSSDIGVSAIIGGVSGGATYAYNDIAVTMGSGNATMGMYWTMGSPNGISDTCVTLFNTPLRCMAVSTGGTTTGLLAAYRLQNAEYIPCPVDSTGDFTTDLTSPAKTGPLNTARWIIRINSASSVTDGQWAVETRLGTNLTTGNYPATVVGSAGYTLMSDLSRTYIWKGTGSNAGVPWGGSGVTPFTERFQFNGDPRHEPYLDCKFGSVALGTQDAGTTIDDDSYNWYFQNVGSDSQVPIADGYSGFQQSTNGYHGFPTGTGAGFYGDMRDMPRYYYLYRRGILQTTGIFTNINGWTCWHASEGGELGGTYQPFQNSLSYLTTPWDPANATSPTIQTIDEIQTSNNWNPTAISGAATNSTARDEMFYNSSAPLDPTKTWFAKHWLGELYPDLGGGVTNYAVTWIAMGNLPTTFFWKVPYEAIQEATDDYNGFDGSRHYEWGVGSQGPAAFFNGIAVGSGGATWGMACEGGSFNSDITNLGLNLYNITNFSLGSPLGGANQRAWNCYYDLHATAADMPPEWSTTYYTNRRTSISVPNMPSSLTSNPARLFYTNEDNNLITHINSSPQTWEGMGIVEMDMGTTQTGYFNISTLAPQGNTGPQILAQTGVNTMIRTFLDGGILKPSGTAGHIPQLPLFQITSGNAANQFTNPTSVVLSWSSPVTGASLWTRWAGFNGGANWYTEEYPGYSVGASITASTYTEPVSVNYVPMWSSNLTTWNYINDGSSAVTGNYYAPVTDITNQSSVTWSVTSLGQGNYTVRVEAFRQGYPLHYSYHQTQLFFTR